MEGFLSIFRGFVCWVFFFSLIFKTNYLLVSPSLLCSEKTARMMLIGFFSENSSQDYGVTPEYICKRNEDVKKAQEEYDNYIQENLKKAAMKRLSDEEREAVLQVSLLESLLSDALACVITGAKALTSVTSVPWGPAQVHGAESTHWKEKKPVVQRFVKYFI